MEAKYITFPGKGARQVPVPGATGTVTLNAFLEAAGDPFDSDGKVDYLVDGETVKDGNAPVREGSTVTKTARVAGG